MTSVSRLFVFAAFLQAPFLAAQTELEFPQLTRPIHDEAHFFSEQTNQEVSEFLLAIRQKGGPQLAVLTLESIAPWTVEQATIKVFDRWQLGSKEQDDGILVFIAKKERKVRIEVGRGVEGVLPDAIAKRIIMEEFSPRFKQGNYDGALRATVARIIERTAPEIMQADGATPLRRRASVSDNILAFLVFPFFILIAIIALIGRLFGLGGVRSRGGWYGGGGGYGGGSSGGGWSGGGGSSAGGGASGDW